MKDLKYLKSRPSNKTLTAFAVILSIICINTRLFAVIEPQIKFGGIDLRSNTSYKYRKKPLENNSKYKNANYKQKYSSMNTQILDAEFSSTGDAYIRGLTKLKFRSPGLGYTGGVFVVAKDSYGATVLIISAKSGTYLDVAGANNDEARKYGWGIDWTIGSHDYRKWNWKYGFKWYRKVDWDVTIPATVMALNPTIEIVQCHTPSYRALKTLEEFFKHGVSFAIGNTIPIASLIIHIVNKDVEYHHFSTLTRSIVNWSYSSDFMNSVQYEATISIIDSCDAIAEQGLLGIQPGNHTDLINLVYAIRNVSNGSASAANSARSIFNSLTPLLNNVEDFTPSSFEHLVDIMKNLQILLNEDNRLSDKQNEQFSMVISVCDTICTLEPNTPIWNHIGLVFDGVNLAIDISEYDTKPTQAEIYKIKSDVFTYLNKIRNAIIEEHGEGSSQLSQYNTVYDIVELIFNTIGGNFNWQTDLIEAAYNDAISYLNQ